jgi:urease accessory protein
MPVLNGHLSLTVTCDDTGRSYLGRQACSVPYHVGKGYWDGHALIVQAANPTAGVFAGDTMTCDVMVERGGKLLLTTPSASRAHTMPDGHATSHQEFHVADGGWLEVMPELFIPQAGCRYRQTTRIEVAPGGQLFFMETLAPGRTARGESFAFAEIEWTTEICYGRHLIARERYRLSPDNNSLASWRQAYPQAYYASCYVVGCELDPSSLHALHEGIGVSRLAHTGWSIKILVPDSPTLRNLCQQVRKSLTEHLPALRADPRKI